MFHNSIHDQREGYSNLDEFSNSIPSLDGSHDVESTLLWIKEVDKFFDMEYIFMGDHVEFMVHKLKRRPATWWNQFQNIHMYQRKSPIRTWRQMKRFLQTRTLILDVEEKENRPRSFIRSH